MTLRDKLSARPAGRPSRVSTDPPAVQQATPVQEAVAARLARRRHPSASAAALKELYAAPRREWPERIKTDTRLHEVAPLHDLLEHVMRVELYRDAKLALRLTTAILKLPDMDPVVRGRAMRLHAGALHEKGEGEESRRVLQEALTLLASTPGGALERLHARLDDAYLRNEIEDVDVMLEVRRVATLFAQHGDSRGTLRACLMEAAILHDRGDFARAIVVNQNACRIAASLHDEQREAIGWMNAGVCAEQLAALVHDEVPLRAAAYAEDALSYFARATPRYAALNMDAESQKILWSMARLARRYGSLEDARAQLLGVRAVLLERGKFLAAALVALDLMELLVLADRPDLVVSWYDEVAQTFTAAGMPRFALGALERVRVAAQDGRIDLPVLASIRSIVREEFRRAA